MPSLPNILIVGSSGEGKSTSITNLDPATTCLIDVERKGFPFQKVFPNTKEVTKQEELVQFINEAKADKNTKVIVIDSLSKHFENQLNYCRVAFKGYDIYTKYNQSVCQILNMMRSTDKIFVGIMLPEILSIMTAEGTSFSVRRAAVAGKEWEGKVEKEFTIVLHTNVKRNPETKRMNYRFVTNNDGFSEAKSPMGMFDIEKEFLIDNDLNKVMAAIKKYYKL